MYKFEYLAGQSNCYSSNQLSMGSATMLPTWTKKQQAEFCSDADIWKYQAFNLLVT